MPIVIGSTIAGAPVATPLQLVKFGENDDVDTGTVPEDVWDGGGPYPFPTAAAVVSIVSDDPLDDEGSTGARSVTLQGLDASLDLISETVVLDGVVPVVTTQSYFRLWRVAVERAGSLSENAGTITLTHPGPVTIALIRPTLGQTLMAVMTLPRTLVQPRFIRGNVALSRQGAGAATILLQTRELWDGTARIPEPVWRTKGVVGLNSQGSGLDSTSLVPGVPVPPGTDIRLRVIEVSANNTGVSGGYTISFVGPDPSPFI